MNYLYQTWLPSPDYGAIDAPGCERSGEAFSPENPVVEIYVPVQKKL